MDFLIRNGEVYDPETNSLKHKDIALTDGLIARPDPGRAYAHSIDASGCIVSPGLIDYHVHYYFRGTENGVSPDAASFCSGITTAVDQGSCGAAAYELFRSTTLTMSQVRIFAALAVSSGGQLTDSYPENMDPRFFNDKKILALCRTYPEEIRALKLRMSRGIVAPEQAEEVLQHAVSLAEQAGVRVVIHVTDPVLPLERMAELLRPGDVMCHIYQNRGGVSCLGEGGHIRTGLREARRRGVLFDAANGSRNFDLEVCSEALKEGFLPDVISSDNNAGGYFLQPLHSLPRILSRYLDLGLTPEQVLYAATMAPAQLLGHPELAQMSAGTPADICILQRRFEPLRHEDASGHVLAGTQALVPMMTFKDGKCVYCQADFG